MLHITNVVGLDSARGSGERDIYVGCAWACIVQVQKEGEGVLLCALCLSWLEKRRERADK